MEGFRKASQHGHKPHPRQARTSKRHYRALKDIAEVGGREHTVQNQILTKDIDGQESVPL